MPAAGEYFPPGVEGGRVAVEHDQELLCEAEPAHTCGGVVGPGPGQDVPGDAVGDVPVFKLPDMGAEGGGVAGAVAEGAGVPVVALLEGVGSEPGVGAGAPGVRPSHRRAVHQAHRQAPAAEGAGGGAPTTNMYFFCPEKVTLENFHNEKCFSNSFLPQCSVTDK